MMTPTHASHATSHLTDDELDELLISLPAGARPATLTGRGHIASCAVCQQRFEEFAASLAAFNEASQRWSEARSNTLNRDLSGALAEQQMRSSLWTSRVQWLGPLTAAVLVAAAMVATPGATNPFAAKHGPAPATQRAPAQAMVPEAKQPVAPLAVEATNRPLMTETAAIAPAPAPRSNDVAANEARHTHDTRELASDNAILLAIDSAIDPQEPTPDEFYHSSGGAAGPLNKVVASQVND